MIGHEIALCSSMFYLDPPLSARPVPAWSSRANRVHDPGSGRYTRLSALKSASPIGAHSEENELLEAVRRSLKTQQHAHSSIEPSIEIVCPGSTPSLGEDSSRSSVQRRRCQD